MTETCGCCEGVEPLTPLTKANRPGLGALSYRAGTHATFLETMTARLSAAEYAALAGLATRAADDPSIAMLDAWATVADVLTFYGERIANEGYLRTATERRSILELARLVGYVPRPGVAASVYLAFTLEDRYELEIPAGTRAQSLPGPGELPQFFETSEGLEARAYWNVLKPRLTRPQPLRPSPPRNGGAPPRRLYLKGLATNLQPGDPLLIDFGATQEFFKAHTVEPDPEADRTLVTLAPVVNQPPTGSLTRARIEDASQRVERFLDLEAYEVSRATQTSGRVVGILEDWRDELTPEASPEELVDSLRERVLPQLRRDLDTARRQGHTKLAPWLEQIVGGLQGIEEELSAAGGESSLARVSSAPSIPIGNGGSPSASLDELLERLGEPPSVQPVNAAKLRRSLEESFGAGSDAVPQLLTTVRPELGRALYRAWEQTGAEPNTARVYALRATDSPFGHNAPLRPIFGDDAKIKDYEEWTLEKTTQESKEHVDIRVQVGWATELERYAFAMTISIGDDSARVAERPLENTSTPIEIRLGEERATLTISGVQNDSFNFRLELPGRRMLVVLSHLGVVIGVRDEGNEEDDGISRIESALSDEAERSQETQITVDIVAGEFEVFSRGSDPTEVDVQRLRSGLGIVVQGNVQARSTAPTERPNVVSLGTSYKEILPEGWVVLERPSATEAIPRTVITRGAEVREASRADYGITARGTQLTLSEDWIAPGRDDFAVIRGTSVHAGSELLELADAPLEVVGDDGVVEVEPLCGEQIELDALYDGLKPGRWLFVTGEREDLPGVTASELVMLAGTEQGVQQAGAVESSGATDGDTKGTTGLPGDRTHSFLRLAQPLAYCYRRETVRIYGNVVGATHGETRSEVLGSGNGGASFQRFGLKQSPLTHVAATAPGGVESTLKAYVNDVRWHEAEHLGALSPTDRRFITQTDDTGEVTTVFGDGVRGARLPTGVENARAVYRTGIGKAGNVAEDQISLLATRPLGLKGVINPLPATGGADRETRDQARRNAPLRVKVLDRLVSVRDYEDFARAFAGIGKSAATRLSDGRQQLVHLTVAGADDIPIAETSELYRHLLQALRRFGDPQLPVRVEVRELILLIISAGVRLLPGYLWESVEPKIRAALLETLGFERRDLGQDAPLSGVIGTIQRVPGVSYVDVDTFGGIPEKTTDAATGLRRPLSPTEIEAEIKGLVRGEDQPLQRVRVGPAGSDGGSIRPAQLAYLTPRVPDTLILKEITA